MRTKCVGMVAGVLGLCLVAHAEEPGAGPTVTPVDASDYKPFVVPVPKDESGFSVKPPPGAWRMSPSPRTKSVEPATWHLPKLNGLPLYYFNWQLPQSSHVRLFREMSEWRFTDVPLSQLLTIVEKVHRYQVLICSAPQTLPQQQDVKISMMLKKGSMEESLDNLKVIGLVWRRLGDTYYVAWDENHLPTAQAAIMPSPGSE
jgi:hypothetical protein